MIRDKTEVTLRCRQAFTIGGVEYTYRCGRIGEAHEENARDFYVDAYLDGTMVAWRIIAAADFNPVTKSYDVHAREAVEAALGDPQNPVHALLRNRLTPANALLNKPTMRGPA